MILRVAGLIRRSHRRTKAPHDIQGLVVLGNVRNLGDQLTRLHHGSTLLTLVVIQNVLRLLRLRSEIERNDDGIDGHEILTDLAGHSHVRKDDGQHNRHQTLDRQQICDTLSDNLHETSPFILVSLVNNRAIFV